MASASLPISKYTTPIFFWREYDREGYLSKWYPSPFTVPSSSSPSGTNTRYLTAEQYMMHAKTLLFSDPITVSKILETSNPKEQKYLGRLVQNFDEKVWNSNRERIVEEGTYWKFKNGIDEGENMSLLERLLKTGARELIKASSRDRIWGIGFGWRNAEARREH